MAEIDSRVKGKSLEGYIAGLSAVQNGMDKITDKAGRKATRLLKQHRHDGHSFITVEKADTHRFIVLSDERGQRAAMSIEYGRKGGRSGSMAGLFILHKSVMGLEGRK